LACFEEEEMTNIKVTVKANDPNVDRKHTDVRITVY